MIIRSLEDIDCIRVKNIMASHPLQFPQFIIDKYPLRWSDFLEKHDHKICGYYVAQSDIILGHAGYIFDFEKDIYEIVGVVVRIEYQRNGIGKALLDTIYNKVRLLGGNKHKAALMLMVPNIITFILEWLMINQTVAD